MATETAWRGRLKRKESCSAQRVDSSKNLNSKKLQQKKILPIFHLISKLSKKFPTYKTGFTLVEMKNRNPLTFTIEHEAYTSGVLTSSAIECTEKQL